MADPIVADPIVKGGRSLAAYGRREIVDGTAEFPAPQLPYPIAADKCDSGNVQAQTCQHKPVSTNLSAQIGDPRANQIRQLIQRILTERRELAECEKPTVGCQCRNIEDVMPAAFNQIGPISRFIKR
jgi:hypothetical protein